MKAELEQGRPDGGQGAQAADLARERDGDGSAGLERWKQWARRGVSNESLQWRILSIRPVVQIEIQVTAQ